MSGHTPDPWRIAPPRDYPNSTEINIDSGQRGTGGFICTVGHRGDPQAEADAAFMVEAVNSHAALVAERDALKVALSELVDAVVAEVNEKGGGGYILARLADARAALSPAHQREGV